MRLDDDFRDELAGHDLDHLEATANAVIGLRADTSLAYANPAWLDLAAAHPPPLRPAHRLGVPFLASVPDLARPLYQGLFDEVRHHRRAVVRDLSRATPVFLHPYRLRVLPLVTGLLLVYRPQPPVAHPPAAAPVEDVAWRTPDGHRLTCTMCGATRRAEEERWDLIPAWAGGSDLSIPGVCPTCLERMYPELPPGARQARLQEQARAAGLRA